MTMRVACSVLLAASFAGAWHLPLEDLVDVDGVLGRALSENSTTSSDERGGVVFPGMFTFGMLPICGLLAAYKFFRAKTRRQQHLVAAAAPTQPGAVAIPVAQAVPIGQAVPMATAIPVAS